MKCKLSLIGIIIFLAHSQTHGQIQSEEFDYGQVEAGQYVNSYFGLEMTLPENWVTLTKEQLDYLSNRGKELVSGDDEKMKAIIRASEVNIANLLAVYQYELGSPVEYNPGIMMVAENLANSPGIKSGSDYLFLSRRMLMQSQFKYDYLDEQFDKVTINGVDFYTMNATMNYIGVTIRQTYYSTVRKGFSFNIIIAHVNDEQKQEQLKSLSSMIFRQ